MRITRKQVSILIHLIVLGIIWFALPALNFEGFYIFGGFMVPLGITVAYFIAFYMIKAHFVFKMRPLGGDTPDDKYFDQISDSLAELMDVQTKGNRIFKAKGLYTRPWYLVLGSSKSGKSTLLENSGEVFSCKRTAAVSFDDKIGPQLSWYVSDDAVFLDASSRLCMANSTKDDSIWGSLLHLLTKARVLKPINGLIVTLSADLFLKSDENEFERSIGELKSSLKAFSQSGYSNLPIYIFITKMDEIPGFSDFFSKQALSGHDQAWGVTFPFNLPLEYPNESELYLSEFNKLLEHLNNRLLEVMRKQSIVNNNQNTYYFPRYIAFMKDRLNRLLTDVLLSSSFSKDLKTRGIYFSAVTQSTTDGFNGNKQQSYFITDIFKEVILRESSRGSWLERIKSFSWKNKKLILAGGVLGIIIFVIAWTTGFTRSSHYLSTTRHEMLTYKNLQSLVPQDSKYTNKLTIMEKMADLEKRDYSSWWLHLGFSFPDEINSGLNNLYHTELRSVYEPYIISQIELNITKILKDLHTKQYTPEEAFNKRSELYIWLSSYVMFRDTQHMDKKQVQTIMDKYWSNIYPQNAKIKQKLNHYLAQLLTLKLKPYKLNQDLIKQTQKEFGGDLYIFRAYTKFKREAQQRFGVEQNLNLGGVDSRYVFQKPSVINYAYTITGWNQYSKEQLVKDLSFSRNDQWIFNNSAAGQEKSGSIKALNKLYTLYWQDYASYWWNAVTSLKFKAINFNTSFEESIRSLNHTKSVLKQTINQVKSNLTSDAITELVKNTKIHSDQVLKITKFVKSKYLINELLSSIESLNNIMIVMNKNQQNLQFQAYNLSKLIATNQQTSYVRLANLQKQAPAPMNMLIKGYMENVTSSIFLLSSEYIKSKWIQNISPACKQEVATVYPFSNSATDMSFSTLDQNFGQNGLFTNFINTYLIGLVNIDEDGRLKVVTVDGIRFPLSKTFENTLNIASELKTLMYSSAENGNRSTKSSSTPKMIFEMKPLMLSSNLTKFKITYSGKSIHYSNGPRYEQKVIWPDHVHDGTTLLSLSELYGYEDSHTYYGKWGLVKLLSTLKYSNSNHSYYFDITGHKAYYNFNVIGHGTVGVLPELKEFNCTP